jgi:putative glycosyltransferase
MKLSVVTTMYYSRNYLHEFYNRCLAVIKELNLDYEFIFVDDGSPDDSLKVALDLQNLDSNIQVVELSRNFGHQRAIMTGLQQAIGDYIFLIDCDLEEDPELLKTFWGNIQKQKEVDVFYGVQIRRKGDWFERISGRIFYKILSKLSKIDYPADTLTARVMSRRYLEAVKKFEEKELDLWGVFALSGFKQVAVPVIKKYKGSSTFTFRKKISHAVEVITSFTHRPLYLTFLIGIFCFLIALVNVVVIGYKKFFLQVDVEGWASILASVWLIGGMIFLVLGIFGIYLSKIFLEIKSRPLTLIKEIYKKE